MAYPKTPEELKIYKELLEKYKDDRMIIRLVKWQAQDETNHEPWADSKIDYDLMANDGWMGNFPVGTFGMRGGKDKK